VGTPVHPQIVEASGLTDKQRQQLDRLAALLRDQSPDRLESFWTEITDVKTTTDLIEQLRRLGRKLDDASDPATMKYLLRCRRALHAAIEAARVTADVPHSGLTPIAGVKLYLPD
jgi:hypothetical protein